MDNNQVIIMAALAVLLLLLLFIIFREVMCWYWKINKIVELLTEINDNLKEKETKQLTSSDYF